MLGLLTIVGIILIIIAFILLVNGLFILAITAIGTCIVIGIVLALVELLES